VSEKRRGLGRGLGALIPSGPAPAPRTGDRPVDVFFPERDQGGGNGGFTGNTGASGDGTDGVRETPPAQAAETAAAEAGDATQDATDVATSSGATQNGGATQDGGATQNGGGDRDGLVPVPGARFAEVPVTRITPNPRQPRTVFDEEALAELVHSVREIGVLQPVVVRPIGEDQDGPRYELVMGERRWRATQEAGLDAIPAIIRETTDDDLLRDALLENLHRSQLNPLEEAAAYQQLLDDFGCTHDELAQRIGRSRPQITNTLRLMKLPPLVQRRVAAGVLSAGHARALLGLADGAAMERLAQRIVAEGLSVRATEEIVALGGDDAPEPARRRPRAGERQGALDDLATRLSDRLDTRVRIALGQRKGKLTVEFASVEDLNRILGELAPDVPGVFRSN
jgi:ParB family chromosome partitioning protein